MRNPRLYLLFTFVAFVLVSCVTSQEFDRAQIEQNEEFDKVVTIKEMDEPEAEAGKKSESSSKSEEKKASASEQKTKSTKKADDKKVDKKSAKSEKELKKETAQASTPSKEGDKAADSAGPAPHLPELEDGVGFDGRRPIVEPYRVGEEITLGISYFAVEAGKFTMQVRPMVEVNGRKSYHFRYLIKSSPLFNMFYKVDDVAETFVDYETLLPYHYEIHVDESKQIRETKTYFDHEKKQATMWDRKQKPDGKVEKVKETWDLPSYSQNVFSAPYYLRNFTLEVGKTLKVRVGHEGKNIVMSAKVLRRETIYTDAGKFDCFVVQPKFNIDGKFKPIGENYLWLTADQNKYIVRLESKIKIGTIVGEVQNIKK